MTKGTPARSRKKSLRSPPSQPEPPLPRDTLRRLYTAMVACRTLAERLGTPSRAEAIWAGALSELGQAESLLLTSDHLPATVLRGATAADVSGKLGSGDRVAGALLVPAGYAVHITTGYALAQPKQMVVLLCSTPLAPLAGCLRLAGRQRLPLVVVVCNTHTGARSTLLEKAKSSKVPVITVDAHDAVAIYRVASEAISRARAFTGVTVIECRPWRPADPINVMQRYLARFGLWSDALETEARSEARSQIG